MNRTLPALALFAATILISVPAGAADPASAPESEHHRHLQVLTPEQLDPSRLLPPPDADGSDLQKADLARVQQIYRTRSPERRARAEWDDKHESVALFDSVLGPQFDLARLPLTATELAMLMLENPAFHAQFEAARDELRAAGLTTQVVAGK